MFGRADQYRWKKHHSHNQKWCQWPHLLWPNRVKARWWEIYTYICIYTGLRHSVCPVAAAVPQLCVDTCMVASSDLWPYQQLTTRLEGLPHNCLGLRFPSVARLQVPWSCPVPGPALWPLQYSTAKLLPPFSTFDLSLKLYIRLAQPCGVHSLSSHESHTL